MLNPITVLFSLSVSNEASNLDAAVIATAVHGHVSVHINDMVPSPKSILDLCKYAYRCTFSIYLHRCIHGNVSCVNFDD